MQKMRTAKRENCGKCGRSYHAVVARYPKITKHQRLHLTFARAKLWRQIFMNQAETWAKNWSKNWAKFSAHFRASCAVQNDPPNFSQNSSPFVTPCLVAEMSKSRLRELLGIAGPNQRASQYYILGKGGERISPLFAKGPLHNEDLPLQCQFEWRDLLGYLEGSMESSLDNLEGLIVVLGTNSGPLHSPPPLKVAEVYPPCLFPGKRLEKAHNP